MNKIMGYYSKHKLTIEEKLTDTNDVIFKHLLDNYEEAGEVFDKLGEFGEEVKAYDIEQILVDVSREYPNKVFVLDREGEEQGDITKTYFVNGKSKQVKLEMHFPEVDLDNL